MKHKNWRVPRRNPTGTSEQQRALAGMGPMFETNAVELAQAGVVDALE